jgi:hypothetical protein
VTAAKVFSGLPASRWFATHFVRSRSQEGIASDSGVRRLALRNRFLVLCVGIMLLIWGAFSFRELPVEAYPDVANNYVQVITQWPGRAAKKWSSRFHSH